MDVFSDTPMHWTIKLYAQEEAERCVREASHKGAPRMDHTEHTTDQWTKVYTAADADRLADEDATEFLRKAKADGLLTALHATARSVEDPGASQRVGVKIAYTGTPAALGALFFSVFKSLPPEARQAFAYTLTKAVEGTLEGIIAASVASHPDVAEA